MNELLWVAMLAVNFAAIMIAFRTWGKTGLLIWMPISVIVANIQVTKTVTLFGFEATLGNIVYATSFLATDILSEFYGDKSARSAVKTGFFSLIAMTVMMQLALLFEPAPSDVVQQSMEGIFALMPRIAFGSLVAYVISNAHDVWAYQYWKKKDAKLWMRNNFSTFVSQIIDSLLFTSIAFYGVFENMVLVEIFATTLLLKLIVAIFDTPFIYLARKWVNGGKIADLQADPGVSPGQTTCL